MALNINTNIGALNAAAAASSVNKMQETAMERLSTGQRINSAADDAAGTAIASRLTSEIKGVNQAIRNAMDGQAMIDTAEGAHNEVDNILQRVRELAVQSANDTNNVTDRANLQLEVDQLLTEIDRISQSTTWAGKGLLNGTSAGTASSHTDAASFKFQIGSGTSGADQLSVSIGAISSAALGLKGAAVASATATGADNPAHMTINGNTIAVEGDLVNGDVFEFDVNDVEVSVTYSTTDQYTNDLAGLGAQLKDKMDALVAAGTITSPMTTVDNGDGSISISQSGTPTINTLTATTAGDGTMTLSGNTLTVSSTWAADDVASVKINGILASYTVAADDGFSISTTGVSAGLAQAIRDKAGLENVTVVDNGDGTLTLSQSDTPVLEAAEVALNNQQTMTVSYDDAGVISVGGAFAEGKEVSFELLGRNISVTTSTTDGFEDTKAGVANQIAAAINNAGIHGITAAKTANANTVTLTAKLTAENAQTVSGTQSIITSVGAQATATVSLSSSSSSVAAATYTAGDSYSFELAGESFSFTVGTDGYADDKFGVAEQMADLINDRGIAGVTATVSTATTAAVSVTRALTGVTSGSGGSTVMTNTLVKDAGSTAASGSGSDVSVANAAGAADTITRVDEALQTISTQRANLGAYSNRLDSTVSNLTNISTNLEAGRSRIQDADFAAESTKLAKAQILQQASMAMLAQANASKQGVLSLLQG